MPKNYLLIYSEQLATEIELLCQKRTQNRIQLFVPILHCLLLFRGIFAI